MKRYVALTLSLCLLAGCGGRTAETPAPLPTVEAEASAVPSPIPAPEPTEAPTPDPAPGPALPEEALALLELSDTDYVMDQAAGDLNGDGLTDWAVVVERPSLAEEPNEYFADAPRTLAILLNDGKDGYTLGQTNDRFIRRDTQGGMNPDPYDGILIKEGELRYSDYGGSAWKWGNSYTFSWRYDMLILTRLETMTLYGERGIEECYDFEEGRYAQRAFSEGGWDCGTGLLWEQEISAAPLRLEDMANPLDGEWLEASPWLKELPPLPDLGFYGYEERLPLERRPEELLDEVQRERFPDMSREDLPWTEETRANYAKAIGGEVPGYYYADGEGRLSWYGGDSVMYKSLDGETLDFY